MQGLVVVDKPEGPTSFDVVHQARKTFGTRAVGHTGTLDPLASGVLVLLLGTWTRLQAHLTAQDKRYLARVVFGAATDTDDRAGTVIARADTSGLDRERIAAALSSMLGAQLQRPPAHSAIHVDGERAYAKARRGEVVEMAARAVRIDALDLLSWDPPAAVIDVRCGKGTYVRAIARDLGERLGVPAHLGALRRTASGPYTLADASPLDAMVLQTELTALRGIELVGVSADDAAALRHGRKVRTSHGDAPIAIAHVAEAAVALVRIADGEMSVERGL